MKAEEELSMLRRVLSIFDSQLLAASNRDVAGQVRARIDELETGSVCPICKSVQPRAPRPPPGPRRTLFDHEK